MMRPIWRRFSDGIPLYLARHYWQVYLWRPALWFFDHQPIINTILFGQYKRLLKQTLHCINNGPPGHLLQLTCVYGKLTPTLVETMNHKPLYLADVAAVQLALSRRKLTEDNSQHLQAVRMNAESLAWRNNSFATVLIFFLLHEMPPEARARVLHESLRILQPGGRLVVTEYGALPERHWLYRFPLSRWLLMRLEPFLDGFWREDLTAELQDKAQRLGKPLQQVTEQHYFAGFYRVVVYQVTE